MKLIHYAPVIGSPIAMNQIIRSGEDFQTKSFQAALVGAVQAGFVIAGMNSNYLSARKAYMVTRVGIRASSALTVATPAMAAVILADPIHKAHHKLAPGKEGSRSDNKSFWTSVSQSLTGGFGTGGWKSY